jgi:hypothetical protein
MMPTDLDIVALCDGIYAYPGDAPVAWDQFDTGQHGDNDDGICWALKHLDGYDVLVFRGSTTMQDWIRDFRALAIPTRIGMVHAGFFSGMEHAWRDIRPLLKQPTIVTGHSLGAGRAAIMTGLMKADGMPPVARVVFGEPKPGLQSFAQFIADVPGRSYRNGDYAHHDLITDVPFSFPPLQYMHPTPVIEVTALPDLPEYQQWGVFAWHNIKLYVAALAAPVVERIRVPISA